MIAIAETTDPVMQSYLRFHEPRFRYVLQVLEPLVRPGMRVLDIGMSRLTELIHEQLQVAVDAMGFAEDHAIDSGEYFHFDLNDCQHAERCRDDLPRYDAIVFAEVIEHLHTSPMLVLGYLATLLKPGGRLIVQTPNAVALPRRVAMFMGRNPYERIREDWTNPGHFREYTAAELREYGNAVGLDCERIDFVSYFNYRHAHHGLPPSNVMGTLKNAIYPWLPRSLRPGLTVVYRR